MWSCHINSPETGFVLILSQMRCCLSFFIVCGFGCSRCSFSGGEVESLCLGEPGSPHWSGCSFAPFRSSCIHLIAAAVFIRTNKAHLRFSAELAWLSNSSASCGCLHLLLQTWGWFVPCVSISPRGFISTLHRAAGSRTLSYLWCHRYSSAWTGTWNPDSRAGSEHWVPCSSFPLPFQVPPSQG